MTGHKKIPAAASAKDFPLCPIAQASSLIGDMWILLIIRDLLKKPRRFCELQQSVVPALGAKRSKSTSLKNPINSRTLTVRLKTLEESGIIKRTAFPHEMPPKVEYALTEKGKALSQVLKKIREYGKKFC